jgi:GxxExxY protein
VVSTGAFSHCLISRSVILLVERELVIEVKAVDRILPIHEAQILTYLRLAGLHLGLLMNFNEHD